MTAMQTEELSKEVEEILKDEEQVKEILKEAGYEVTEEPERSCSWRRQY